MENIIEQRLSGALSIVEENQNEIKKEMTLHKEDMRLLHVSYILVNKRR